LAFDDDNVGSAGVQSGAIRHGEDDDVKAAGVHIRAPSSILHRATNDDVGAASIQPGAIHHPRSATMTSAQGMSARSTAPSPPPTWRDDDIRARHAGAQHGAISTTHGAQRRYPRKACRRAARRHLRGTRETR
jgi:hypothetical protein